MVDPLVSPVRKNLILLSMGADIFHSLLQNFSPNLGKYLICSIGIFTDQDRLKEIFREVQIMSQLKGPAIVKFYSAWMEDNEFIYILMELCQDNMRRLIDHKPVVFDRDKGAAISRTEYFISWHLLKELIEAVNYLHSCTPKIIHRDLKPANVLVTDGHGGSFIKLCDFGLSKTHEHSSHTTHQGTKRYMAPEVRIGRQYNEKSDVFSLCVMALELFGFVFKDFKDLYVFV